MMSRPVTAANRRRHGLNYGKAAARTSGRTDVAAVDTVDAVAMTAFTTNPLTFSALAGLADFLMATSGRL